MERKLSKLPEHAREWARRHYIQEFLSDLSAAREALEDRLPEAELPAIVATESRTFPMSYYDCPVCGTRPRLVREQTSGGGGLWWVRCNNFCCANFFAGDRKTKTRQEAVQAWRLYCKLTART